MINSEIESQESKIESQSPIKLGLLLLGSFILAYLGAEFLHEICHAGAAIVTGGRVRGISVHPFSWSYSQSSSSEHPIIHTAAGALGSSLIGLLIFIVSIRWARPLLLPLLLLGPVLLIDNGLYWTMDIILGMGADACRLIDMGVPSLLVLSAGLVQLITGIVLVICLMRIIGLTSLSFLSRLTVLGIGVIPYALAGVFLNWHSDLDSLWLSSIGVVFLLAIVAGFFKIKESRLFTVKWPLVTGYNIVSFGIVFVLFFSMISNYKQVISKFTVQTFYSRPLNFPSVLIPHEQAISPDYIIYPHMRSGPTYILTYDLPESVNPASIRKYLTDFYIAQGFVPLSYSVENPIKPLDDSWIEKHSQIGLKKHFLLSYKQEWIKLTPIISRLFINVHYVWDGNKFNFAGVHLALWNSSGIDNKVLIYADYHSEAFDWFEVEQLRLRAIFRRPEPKKMTELYR